ncbi:YihY/virulence factor BrkB family protein [Actinotalea sp. Marseille-Q4924]|uniref:YihY/virulence factor BrkB family protein n=1 Tax=Actinotalea sp. Marseille-Q4924 TaxID=2866571 RepID=UPI001CE3D185|nr:YihY/virulence factor BrkB family protein [Actinotalea sp. Marseille-Q4924]
MGAPVEEHHPGAHAHEPDEIPPRGWWQVLVRALQQSAEDRVPLVGAGVAFFAFLALFPTLIAAVLLYGLVADPGDVDRHVGNVAAVLPSSAAELVTLQMRDLVAKDAEGLSIGFVVSIVTALWSASVGVANLITAVNLAYDETERVSFVKRRGMALLFTVGAILTFTLLVGLVAVVPFAVDTTRVSPVVVSAVRWVTLALVSAVVLAVIYRYAPERRAPRSSWVSVGAVVATAIWVLTSLGFSGYVQWFGSYTETYGALGGVMVLLLWMWLTSMAVLLGAELNAEAEYQTDEDTTVGPDRPRGRRGAVKADTAVGRPDPPGLRTGVPRR